MPHSFCCVFVDRISQSAIISRTELWKKRGFILSNRNTLENKQLRRAEREENANKQAKLRLAERVRRAELQGEFNKWLMQSQQEARQEELNTESQYTESDNG